MRLIDLRAFVAVVEAGSMTRAAATTYVSQPALSQRMTQLEAELGVRLLDRSVRGVRPTSAGTQLYRRAIALVRQFDELAYDMASQTQIAGPVTLGLPVTVALPMAQPLFHWTREHHPGVYLQLFESSSGYIRELLQWERLDLAVQFRSTDEPRPNEQFLFSEDMYLVGKTGVWFPHSAGKPNAVAAVGELGGIPLVVSERHSNLRTQIDAAFLQANTRPKIVAEMDGLRTRAMIAASGDACGILPMSTVTCCPDLDLDYIRIVEPYIRRFGIVAAGPMRYPLNEAAAAVTTGLKELTRSLADSGVWTGIQAMC